MEEIYWLKGPFAPFASLTPAATRLTMEGYAPPITNRRKESEPGERANSPRSGVKR